MTEHHPLGRVVGTSRRFVYFLLGDSPEPLTGTASSRALEATIGDLIEVEERGSEWVVTKVLPAGHRLTRSYRGEIRTIAHNLDHLFIVTAVPPLFNTHAIDRVLTVAHQQQIPCTILFNKIDLAPEDTEFILDPYRAMGTAVLATSAKLNRGLDKLSAMLHDSSMKIAAFTGISGAGKSTLLNRLVPGLTQRTGEVSRKTGQGKQTTSHPIAHLFKRPGMEPALLIDLPGIQNFGVAHLSREEIVASFPEFRSLRVQCPFDNCSHINEELCVVKDALETGELSASRYLSYLGMIEECEEGKRY
jgi:ribosome biogenesis GTPase